MSAKQKRSQSGVAASVRETVAGLNAAGIIDAPKVREFDFLSPRPQTLKAGGRSTAPFPPK